MWTLTSVRSVLLALLVATGATAMAQSTQDNESDLDFLNRIQSRFDRVESRIDYVDKTVRQRMGLSTSTGNRIGVDTAATQNRMSADPMNSELRRLRLDLKQMEKKVKKERERMTDHYRNRDQDGFDHEHFETVIRRFELKLDETERDLRRL